MSPTQNPTVIFNEIPKGAPDANTLTIDDKATIDLDAPLNGGFIVKTLCYSLDPYMRGRMRESTIKSYTPAFELHKPIANFSVSKVIRSESSQFKEGDHVYGVLPFAAYVKCGDNQGLIKLENKEGLPWTVYVGAAGMPGKTAYMGWKEIAEAKKGETVFVSAGSGPVGQMVIQIAKSQGLKVIASVGSAEKVAFCKEIGADIAFNYKTDDAKAIFEKEGPIDINWVNVGGEAFETELQYMNNYGRCICGWISGYNGESYGIKNLFNVVTKRLKFRGFIVSDFQAKYDKDFYAEIPKQISSGSIKIKEHFYDGLEQVPQAFREMLNGTGFGKVVINVADE